MEALFVFFKDPLISYSLALPRLVSVFSVLAFMSRQSLGGTLTRNGILMSLALLLYPVVHAESAAISALSTGLLVAVVVKEIGVGLMMGFIVALVFWAVEAVGAFIDNQRGATMASAMDPLTGDQSSPLGTFFVNTLTAVFFVSGLFLVFMESVYASYKVWPVVSFFPQLNFDIVVFLLEHFGRIVLLAVVLGAPAIIAMFVAEFGLMLVGRFAPQLNIFFMSMSVKSAVSNFILVISLGIIIGYFSDALRTIAETYAKLDAAWGSP